MTQRHSDTQNITKSLENTKKNFVCNQCSMTWKNMTLPLDEIQKQHNMNSENHIVTEI